jgi:hypothetical protein
MSILSQVNHSSSKTGIRVVISGVEKVGKTTLACSAPRAMLVPLEQGFGGVNVMKTPMLESFGMVMQLLAEVIETAQRGAFPYQTLVFDSGTALERLIHEAVLQTDPTWAKGNRKALTMESALGGYGKAYQYANELFHSFLQQCDVLAVHGGINIVLTCHVFAARIVDPIHGEYDSYDLLLHSPKNQKSYGKREMLTQWADVIGFIYEPLYVTKGGDKSQLNMGISANKGRVLAVNRTPGYVAGNRYGVVTDMQIPKDKGWNYLAHVIYQSCGLDVYNRDS